MPSPPEILGVCQDPTPLECGDKGITHGAAGQTLDASRDRRAGASGPVAGAGADVDA